MVAIYRGSMPDTTTLLLEADGFDDLATRAEYLQRIEEADAALVDRVRFLRDSVRVQLAAVENAERRIEAFNVRISAARDQIAAVRAEAEQQAAALAEARASRQAALEQLQSQVGDWTSKVQRLERISAEQAQGEVADWLGDWAIPESIVMCESGGNFDAVNPSSGAGGAYQILPSTWELYGGEGNPEDASPAEQSDIASQIWADSGSVGLGLRRLDALALGGLAPLSRTPATSARTAITPPATFSWPPNRARRSAPPAARSAHNRGHCLQLPARPGQASGGRASPANVPTTPLSGHCGTMVSHRHRDRPASSSTSARRWSGSVAVAVANPVRHPALQREQLDEARARVLAELAARLAERRPAPGRRARTASCGRRPSPSPCRASPSPRR